MRLLGIAVMVVLALSLTGRKYLTSFRVLLLVFPLTMVSPSDQRAIRKDYAVWAGQYWLRASIKTAFQKVVAVP